MQNLSEEASLRETHQLLKKNNQNNQQIRQKGTSTHINTPKKSIFAPVGVPTPGFLVDKTTRKQWTINT